MILPGSIFLSFVVWVIERFGFGIALPDERIFEPLDEHELSEQLQHGRD
jgi:hypothetical protein